MKNIIFFPLFFIALILMFFIGFLMCDLTQFSNHKPLWDEINKYPICREKSCYMDYIDENNQYYLVYTENKSKQIKFNITNKWN